MKKLAMLICAAALTVCGSLYAQSLVDTVNVKFASPVMVGSKMLSAGDCTIRIVRSNSDSVVLSLRSEKGETSNILVNRLNDEDFSIAGKADVVLARREDGLHFERLLLPD